MMMMMMKRDGFWMVKYFGVTCKDFLCVIWSGKKRSPTPGIEPGPSR
jgi:hypothetical protein